MTALRRHIDEHGKEAIVRIDQAIGSSDGEFDEEETKVIDSIAQRPRHGAVALRRVDGDGYKSHGVLI